MSLRQLSLPMLHALLRAVESGALPCPVEQSRLVASGFASVAEVIRPVLFDVDRLGVLAVLRVVIDEREAQAASKLELVWSGPLTPQATNRDTGVVMRGLFEKAQKSVIVAGYAIDDGKSLFAPLHRAMVERGVEATLVVNIDGEAASGAGGDEFASKWIAKFLDEQWPSDDAPPAVYYDPRTAVPGPPWVSMHAKCVVVDERWSFVTSANFTERAQERNIELGVLIEDERFAEAVVRQWRTLIREGLLTEYLGPTR